MELQSKITILMEYLDVFTVKSVQWNHKIQFAHRYQILYYLVKIEKITVFNGF